MGETMTSLEQPVKKMLLQVVDQLKNTLTSPDESQDVITEFCNDDQFETKEAFLDPHEAALEMLVEDETHMLVDGFDLAESELHTPNNESRESLEDNNENTHYLDDDYNDETHGDAEFLDDETIALETSSAALPRKKASRQANPENWKRNKRKLAKNKGQSYVASNGKFIGAKQMKMGCGVVCRMQCCKKVSEQIRLKNFSHFYQLADIAKQRKFLFDHMKTYEPKRHKISKNPVRAVQRCYFLNLNYGENATEMVQVCKLMFLNTFSISSQMIDTLYRKAVSEGKFNDTRGKFERKRSKQLSLQHIEECL